MNVAVIGVISKADRYSYKAVLLLREKVRATHSVHPALLAVEGVGRHSPEPAAATDVQSWSRKPCAGGTTEGS